MIKCRRVFNPQLTRQQRVQRDYHRVSKALRRLREAKGKSTEVNPVEIIGRPSAAFKRNFDATYATARAASDASLAVMEDLDAMQAFFEEIFDTPPNTYKERDSFISDELVFPQGGLSTVVSDFISDCVIGHDVKSSVAQVASSIDGATSNFDAITAALVSNSKDIAELASSLKDLLDKNPVDSFIDATGACITYNANHLACMLGGGNTVTSIMATVSFLSFIGTFLFYVAKPTKSTLLIMAFTLAASVYFNWPAVSEFLKVAARFIPSFDMVPHAGVDFDGLLQAISLLLFGLTLRGAKITTLPKAVLDHLKTFKTTKESLKDIISFLMNLLATILDYSSLSEYLPSWARFLNVSDPEVKELFIDIDNVNLCYTNNKFPLTKTNAALVQRLQQKVISLLRTLPVNPSTTSIRDSLKSELPKLNKLMEVFRAAKLTDDGKRIEPVFAIFAGAPGNFKSQMVELLCASLQMKTLDPERLEEAKQDHFRYIYKREQANVYWDGFKDPHIVVFDDIGQFKTCVQNIDNEFADILKGVNELPLPLHMANVDNKGNTYFKARFIIGTTNFNKPKMDNINCPDAYNRRIAHAFYQVPRAEFCTPETRDLDFMSRKLNKAHPDLPRGPHGVILTHPKYHSEFIKYDPFEPTRVIGTFNYDQVVDLLVESYHEKETYYTQKATEVEEVYNGTDELLMASMSTYSKDFNRRWGTALRAERYRRACVEVPFEDEFEDEDEYHQALSDFNIELAAAKHDYYHKTPVKAARPEAVQALLNSGEGSSMAPQGAVIETSFDDMCDIITQESDTEEKFPWLTVDDEFLVSAYKLLHKQNVDISKKCAFVRFEHLKLFGQALEGSDDMVFLRTCLATKSAPMLKYFSSRVNVKDFASAFRDVLDVYAVNIADADVFFPAFRALETDELKKVWASADTSFRATIYNTCYTSYLYVCDWYRKNHFWFNPILAVLATLMTATATASFVKYVSKSSDEEMTEEDFSFEQEAEEFVATNPFTPEPPTPKAKEAAQSLFGAREFGGNGRRLVGKGKRRAKKMHYDDYADTQMAIDADPAAYDLATRINATCLLTMTVETMTSSVRMGHALVIADRVCIVPKHFFVMVNASIKNKTLPQTAHIKVSFRGTHAATGINTFIMVGDFLDPAKWIFTENLDALDEALFVLPADSARKYRSIMDRIATKDMHLENTVRSGFLMGYDEAQNNLATFKFEPIIKQSVFDPLTGSYTVNDAYSYYANTGKGDCGTPLYVHCKTNAKAKIFGIHVAGTAATGRGVSAILVREYLEEALQMVPQSCKITTNCRDMELVTELPFAQGQFMNAYESLYNIPDSGKSKILQSELYEEWGDATTKPAFLKTCVVDGVTVDVKEKAYSKVCIGEWKLSEKVLKDVEDAYFSDMMETYKFEVDKRMYTFEEAVCGLEDDPNFSAIARNTSPGFPYIVDPKVKRAGSGKRYWFGIDQVYDMENPRVKQLKEECLDIIDKARNGVRSEHIFVDCLKDERRPIEKADAGKTRMINSGPMKLLIIMRMYFGAFANWFTQNRVLNGSAIGVNPYSNEWDEVARNLKKFGTSVPNVGAGDYSGYDGSEKPMVHHAILNIINRWYDDGEENALIREVLWAEVVQSKHISGRIIYTWPMSLPSGHPLTALINTMYNGLAFRYCWYRANDMDRLMLNKFLQYVYTIMLGDDNVYTVHPEFVDKFNDINLESWMYEFGLVYTNETKTGTMSELRTLEEVSFLKRAFRYESILGRYVAPLSLSVVLEVPYWTKKKDGIKITEDNSKMSLLELSLHGEETFNKWAPQIVQACKERMDYNLRMESYPVTLETVTDFEYYF